MSPAEKAAREALAQQGHNTSCGRPVRPGWACGQIKGHDGSCGTYVYGVRCVEWKDHLRATLALLDEERALARALLDQLPVADAYDIADPDLATAIRALRARVGE